ncbi:hypothetical protein [Caulobacter sp. S45]|uniref:hypothetical protein n=1 Tax=Caulobacter sp. S45 TaxID=1641861 RepID=UPI00131B3AD6|nr:hypothetical protein [Caulobacter sp. S45]
MSDGRGGYNAGSNAPFGESGPPQKKPSGCLKALGLGILIFVGLGVLGNIVIALTQHGRTASNQIAPANQVASSGQPDPGDQPAVDLHAATGNPSNDALLARALEDRPAILAATVKKGCRGERAYYQGIGHKGDAVGKAFWNVACTNGHAYMLQIEPDKHGTAEVMDCRFLKAIKADQCFTKFPEGS